MTVRLSVCRLSCTNQKSVYLCATRAAIHPNTLQQAAADSMCGLRNVDANPLAFLDPPTSRC